MKKIGVRICLVLMLILVTTIALWLPLKNIQASSTGNVALNNTELTIGVGSSFSEKLIASVTGSDHAILFRSSNSKVAIVNKEGIVTGVSEGSANISCILIGTGKKAVCKITVRQQVQSLSMKDPYINFYNTGETYQVVITVAPQNATLKDIRYSVGDEKVATVDSKGLITAVGFGSTTISAEAMDGSGAKLTIYVKYLQGEYDDPVGISARKNVLHGEVKEITYYSGITKSNRKALVYTPPRYSKNKKYNVLYLCPGGTCDHTQWYKIGANYLLDNLYSQQMVSDMIVVMVDSFISNKKVDDFLDHVLTIDDNQESLDEFYQAYDDLEIELEDYLMPFIKKNYSIVTGGDHTALAGLSMGGREACNIGLKRTDLFSYIGMFSPAPSSDAITNFTSVLEDEIHSLYPPKVIWMSIGSCDSVSGKSTYMVKKALDQVAVQDYFKHNNTNYIFYEFPATINHSKPEWINGLYNFTQLIFK